MTIIRDTIKDWAIENVGGEITNKHGIVCRSRRGPARLSYCPECYRKVRTVYLEETTPPLPNGPHVRRFQRLVLCAECGYGIAIDESKEISA
jgi:uncharacterized protein with PIN domain